MTTIIFIEDQHESRETEAVPWKDFEEILRAACKHERWLGFAEQLADVTIEPEGFTFTRILQKEYRDD